MNETPYTFWSLVWFGFMLVFIGIMIKVYQQVIKKYFKHRLASTNYRETAKFINNELIRLRSRTDANRTYLLQFHNGEEFLAKHPRWKVSQTYASAAFGYDDGGKHIKDVDVTLIWDIVGPLYKDYETLPPGIREIGDDVYLGEVKYLSTDYGHSRSIMQARGVDAFVFAPIRGEDKEFIGILGVSFCERDWQQRLANVNAAEISDVASLISLQLGRNGSKIKKLIMKFLK